MKKFVEAELVEMKISNTQSGGASFRKVDSEIYHTVIDGQAVSYYTYDPYSSSDKTVDGQ